MQQTPKEKPADSEQPCETPDPDAKGSYYYDDSHGYEDFDPDAQDEDEDEKDG